MCVGVTIEELYSESSFVDLLFAPPPLLKRVQKGRLYYFLYKWTHCFHLSTQMGMSSSPPISPKQKK